jgi:hypothetical protein
MRKGEAQKSRRKTPWDGVGELTPTQAFLKLHYDEQYKHHHRKVEEREEAELVNSFVPPNCPYCKSANFKKNGYTDSKVQRYKCGCRRTFLATTGTLNLFRHVSITAGSWNNKNAFTTSRYWLQKLFLTLEGIQDDVVLSGKVWLDETFYRVRSSDIIRDDKGRKLSGLSRNQICIGVATDKNQTVLIVEGTGRPTQKKTLETFREHIQPGSTLIHDEDRAHKKLVTELALESVAYASKDLKAIPDGDNPMNPVNQVHAILKMFLNAHSGFKRDDMQNYLNLFAFVTNPPIDMLEKVELVIKRAFQNPKSLRYRDFFRVNTESS